MQLGTSNVFASASSNKKTRFKKSAKAKNGDVTKPKYFLITLFCSIFDCPVCENVRSKSNRETHKT